MVNEQSNSDSIMKEAELLFKSGDYDAASEKYISLTNKTKWAAIAHYRLAAIANIAKEPLTAKNLYYKAFELEPNICSMLFDQSKRWIPGYMVIPASEWDNCLRIESQEAKLDTAEQNS